jgi:hypothetical protein
MPSRGNEESTAREERGLECGSQTDDSNGPQRDDPDNLGGIDPTWYDEVANESPVSMRFGPGFSPDHSRPIAEFEPVFRFLDLTYDCRFIFS